LKILFLTPQLPYPPRQGTQIRNFHLLKAAAGAHEVDLLSFARPGETLESAGPLRDLCGEITLVPAPERTRAERLRLLLGSPDPDMAHRLRSEAYSANVRSVLASRGYDLVQLAGIEMARYLPAVRACSPRARVVFDDHNAEYLLQERAAFVDLRHPPAWPKALYSLAQWQKLRRYEARVCRDADAVLAVSEEDAGALRRLGRTAPVAVVPNGVDTTYYRTGPDAAREPATLLFTGTMDFRPNVDAIRWFVQDVLPLVAESRPDARLQVVGRSPAPAVLALASENPGVVVTGAVEDVRPYFDRSTLFVVPMRMGGGVRLKVLEALAAGVPLVSTSMGAEGTGLVHEEELLLADTADQFARAVLRLLEDEPLRRHLSSAGRGAVSRRFDWTCVAPRLLSVYDGLRQPPGTDSAAMLDS
jgi:sugar transferase (PEP-CTERM/EpsH1 system associated)